MNATDEQIKEIEKEIRETPYHKGTEHHIGRLRARLARLEDRLVETQSGRRSGGGSSGFAIKKQGDATVVLVGPPSCGKSTLLNKLTNAESKVAPYVFTTVSVIPGMMKYKDAYIQILDVPGLIERAREGRGRGKEVLSVARSADLLLIMTDAARLEGLKSMSEELEGAGIRINKMKPGIIIEKKTSGGLVIRTNVRQSLDKSLIFEVFAEYGIKNAQVTLKEKVILDDLIDAVSQNRAYIPAIFVINKIDEHPNSEFRIHNLEFSKISAERDIGLDILREKIWEALGLARIYLKESGSKREEPMIVRIGDSLAHVAGKIGSEFALTKRAVKIWGPGAKFPGQEVSLETKVQEGMRIRFS